MVSITIRSSAGRRKAEVPDAATAGAAREDGLCCSCATRLCLRAQADPAWPLLQPSELRHVRLPSMNAPVLWSMIPRRGVEMGWMWDF